jgi:PKD repeat protein
MPRTIPVLVTFLMIFSGLASAMIPHDVPSPTVIPRDRTVEPMSWNSSDNGKYDALNADISVTPNLVTGNITANARITVKALKAGSYLNFTLKLLGALKVKSVKDIGNNALFFKQNSTLHNLTINYTAPVSTGQSVTVNVDYQGPVSTSISGDDNCNWSAGLLLKRTTPWYPMPVFSYSVSRIRPRDLDRHNVTVHVLVSKNWTVVSVGKNVSALPSGLNTNVTYKSLNEVAGFTVAAGNYSINTTTHSGLTLTTYLFKANATRSGMFMARAMSVLDWLMASYGAYPYTGFNMVEVNHKLGGIESDQGMVITDTFGAFQPPLNLVVGIADQSFVYASCPIGDFDAWLSWSMSEYTAVYFQIAVDHKNDELRNLHLFYGGGTTEMAIRDIQVDHSKFVPVIFYKGPYVLHMLRYIVGNTTFDGIMQSYLALSIGKNVTLDDFLKAVKQKTSTDLKWFFDQWLNTTAVLDYAVNTAPSMMYRDGNQLKVDFTVKKIGTAAMPGDIGLAYYTGNPTTTLSKLMCQACGVTPFSVNITEDVSSVDFDPDLWLLDVNKDNDHSTPVKEDVRVDSISLSPNKGIIEGDTVTVTTVVKNVGNDAQDFTVAFLDNDTKFGTKQVQALAPNAKTTLSVDWKADKGLRNISVYADSDQVIKEYNKTNNKANTTIFVAEFIPPPDLKFVGTINISKTKITEGDYTYLNVTVLNDYKNPLSGIYVDFNVDSSLVNTVTIGLVKANGTANASTLWQSKAGTHQVKAVLHTPAGVVESNTDNNVVQIQVTVNDIPVARIDVDNGNPVSGVEIEFSGATSSDAIGVAAYKFDFGDGQHRDWAESFTARHKYKYPGEYKATVTVKDNWGIESPPSDPITIIVKDTIPTADFDVFPETGTVNTLFSFTPDARDPDGTVTTYYWQFGDGKSTIETNPVHRYTKAGPFTVQLAVTDNSGQSSIPVTKTVTVKNLKPNALGVVSPTTVNVNDPVTVDATTSWDPDNDKADLRFTWTANSMFKSSKFKDTISFASSGNYNIVLTVTDPDKATNTTSFTVKVNPAPPCTDCGGEQPNNNLVYGAAAGGVAAVLFVILGLFFFMRNKKAKAAAAEVKAKPVAKAKGAKPEAKGTKPAEKKPPVKEKEAEEPEVVEEAPKKPPVKTPVEAPKPAPKAPKPKAVKKPAPKPVAAPKPEEKPATVVDKAKKAAEDEWEQ